MNHLEGQCSRDNPGPGDRYEDLKPLALAE
jgi:hypothetical protein